MTYSVGDALAFKNYGGSYSLSRITKITPSGRIFCGQIAMNPDLSTRGAHSIMGPICVGKPTQEIIDSIRKHRAVQNLKSFDWDSLSLEKIETIVGELSK
jgi:hypothetical protein